MKRTPLYEAHVAHRAKLVDFSGWEMPLQYTGVIDEYQAVRSKAGLFDVSHMGRIAVEGEEALAFLQRVTTNDVAKIEVMGAQYSMICNPKGGIKDDIFLYRLGPDKFLLCVNAANREKIVAWLGEQHAKENNSIEILDRSAEMAQLALQGPASKAILQESVGLALETLKPRGCLDSELFGAPSLITRTGYTGEPGYELYVPADKALEVWEKLISTGAAYGLKPIGLGARDLLRLDMAYFLYGNDLTEETTPIEAGAEWAVKCEKGQFIGDTVLKEQIQKGPPQRLVAFELLEKAVPRHGMKLYTNDHPIGEVASGNLSPILQKGIGLGYVIPAHTAIGTSFQVDIRGRCVSAVVVKPPFYKRPKK